MKALKNYITTDKSHALFLSAKVLIQTLYLCFSGEVGQFFFFLGDDAFRGAIAIGFFFPYC